MFRCSKLLFQVIVPLSTRMGYGTLPMDVMETSITALNEQNPMVLCWGVLFGHDQSMILDIFYIHIALHKLHCSVCIYPGCFLLYFEFPSFWSDNFPVSIPTCKLILGKV